MPHDSSSCRFLTLLLCLFCAVASPAAEPVDVGWDKLRDVQDVPVSIADAQWKVICFLGAECPLTKLYGPRLQRLGKEFAAQGVQIIGINSNPQDSPADIKRYIEEQKISFSMIKDRRQSLARRFGAKRTPEVFVLDASGHVRYQGRIDDQYDSETTAEAGRSRIRRHIHA